MDIFYGIEILVSLGLCIWFGGKIKKQVEDRYVFYFLLFLAGAFFSWALSMNLKNTILSGIVLNTSWFWFVDDPFGISRMIAAVVRWILEVLWVLILNSMMKRKRILTLKRGQKLVFWAMPVMSVAFLISLLFIGDYYVRWNGYGLVIFNIVLLFGMNLVFFYSYQLVAKSYETEKGYKLHKQREELVYQHYLKLEESYQDSRKIIHDLKNHMQAVARLYEEGEIEKAKQYHEEVFHILNQTKHLWYTENRMLNIILNEKLCHKNLRNVRLELDIEEHCLDRIKEIDLTTIFANLLDNAIEAIGIDGGEQRFLKICVKEAKDFLVIHIVNSLGIIGKQEKRHDGLGLGNVKEALEKYEGTCTTEKKENQFEVILMIPQNHFQQEGTDYEKK